MFDTLSESNGSATAHHETVQHDQERDARRAAQAKRDTIVAEVAGDVLAWHMVGPPSLSLGLTHDQKRDLRNLIDHYKDDSESDPAAFVAAFWKTIIDRINDGDDQ